MHKVVVFGGAGFLGGAIYNELRSRGIPAGVADILYPARLSNLGEIEFHQIDIVHDRLEEVITSSVTHVVNCAGVSDLNYGYHHPMECIEANIIGNLRLLDACVKNNVKYIYASTIYVHGTRGSFYRISKSAAEDFILEYADRYGLKYNIIRYGSLYGDGSDKKNGMYRIIERAVTEFKLYYDGSPDTVRRYIHVLDASRDTVDIALQDQNGTLVVTGSEEYAIQEILQMIGEILGIDPTKTSYGAGSSMGHYSLTPYNYRKLPRVYKNKTHIELAAGLTKLISEIDERYRSAC